MPRTITYIECDCKQGRLEKIAGTEVKEETDSHSGNYGFSFNTVFYCCDRCNTIFKENRKYGWGYDGKKAARVIILDKRSLDPASQIVPYEGRLTKSEIIHHSSEIQGILSSFEEDKIISEYRG